LRPEYYILFFAFILSADLGKNKDIKYLQYSESVYDEQDQKPEFLSVAGRFPERESFPGQCPGSGYSRDQEKIVFVKILRDIHMVLISGLARTAILV
jgi:hypothetical protein